MSTQTIINRKSQFYVRSEYIIVNTFLKNQYFYPGGEILLLPKALTYLLGRGKSIVSK